ncbi:hypothetical protein H0H92_001645 [Tricholoma furcatifolium]|nr:hypothetical protein H0H92_001645 [Tricholoma furcatifolium]
MGAADITARPSTSGVTIFYGKKKSTRRRLRSRIKELANKVNHDATGFVRRARNENLQGQLDTPLGDEGFPASSSESDALVFPSLRSKESNDHLADSFQCSARGLLPSVTSAGIVALAKDIAVLFANVPYIQVITSVVQQIIQVADTKIDDTFFAQDVRVNKGRMRELTDKVAGYAKVIFEVLSDPKIVEHGLSELEPDLLKIESFLKSVYQMLQSLLRDSLTSRIKLVLQRQEHLERLNELDRRFDTLIASYQFKFVIRANAKSGTVEVPKLKQASATDKRSFIFSPNAYQPPRSYAQQTRLRSKPPMFGRDSELEQIVTIIQEASPARIAILGSGGIGKTSLALCVLHDERITAQFQNRLFVPCEAAGSVGHIIDDLAMALQIPYNSCENPFSVILDHLGKSPCFLVLDNLETPWESLSARSGVEDFLRELTSLDTVTLMVTMRGSQRPSTVHWTELLPPLQPVSLDAAVDIFFSISQKSDEFAVKLIKAVDCVPLAVTLLANLASVDGETTEALWRRWCTESVSMVENGNDRLSSFDNSIEMSLSSPRMQRDGEALRLLSIISLLPGEISSRTVRAFEDGIPGIGNVKKAFSTLLQNALIHKDVSGCIRILSPIRLHMCARHPSSVLGQGFVQDYFIDFVDSLASSHDASDSETFRAEHGNIEAMLLDSLEVPLGRPVEDIIDTIIVFCQMAYTWGISSTHAITSAVAKLADRPLGQVTNPVPKTNAKPRKGIVRRLAGLRMWKDPLKSFFNDVHNATMDESIDETAKLLADCLGCEGQLLSRQARFAEAERSFDMAIQLHVKANDIGGLAYDLHNMASLFSRHPDTVDRAEDMFKKAYALHQQIGDLGGAAYDLVGQGQLLLQQSQPIAAKEPFMRALQEFRSCGDETGQSAALYNLGHAVLSSSKPSDAEASFSQALDLSVKNGDIVGQTESLAGLACTLLLRSRFSEAKDKIEQAISLLSPAENPDHLHILARVNVALYSFDTATDLFRRAEALHLQMKDERGCAEDRLYLLQIDYFQGQLLKGCDKPMADNVVSFCKRLEQRLSSLGLRGLADPQLLIGTIRLHTVDVRGGRDLIEKSNEDGGKRGDLGSGFYHYQVGCFHLRLGELPEAEANFIEALRFHEKTENVQGQADDYNRLALVSLRMGRPEDALATIVLRAFRLHAQIGDISGQGDDLRIQACIFLEQARLQEAEELIRKALELHTESKMALGRGLDLATLSSVLWKQYLNQRSGAPSTSLPTDRSADALDALERAADVFASFVAHTQLTQCQARYRDMLKVKPNLQTTSEALLTPMSLFDHEP